MSILRPSIVSVLSPPVTRVLRPALAADKIELLLLGADGSVVLVDHAAQAGSVVSVADIGGSVVLEMQDTAVIAETADTVTLEFAD